MVCWKSEIHTSWICCFMRKTNNDMLPECCSFREFQFCSNCESRLCVSSQDQGAHWLVKRLTSARPLANGWSDNFGTARARLTSRIFWKGFWVIWKRMKFNRPDFHQSSIFYPKSLWEVFIYINLHIGYDFSWFDSYRCFLTCKSMTQSLI